jgi:hypothetical protein
VTGRETACALFGAAVKGALSVGGSVEGLEVSEIDVAKALVVEQKGLLCTGKVGIVGVQDANVG